MVHAKNYETVFTFVKVMQKTPWPLFFLYTVYYYQRGSITSYASAGIARAEMFIHTLISTESK